MRNNDQLIDIAETHGSAYVYDLDAIAHRIALIRHAFPEFRLYYSVKANPLPEIMQLCVEHNVGFEVASIGELDLIDEKFPKGADIIMAGPAKSPLEIETALRRNIWALNAESADEVAAALRFKDMHAASTILAARINPLEGLSTRLENMTGEHSRFGLDLEELIEDVNLLSRIEGIHHYAASQVLSEREIVGHILATWQIARNLAAARKKPLDLVNFGGGFGVPHQLGVPAINLQLIANQVRPIIDQDRESTAHSLVLELGRFLVSEAGVLLTRVRAVKSARGAVFAFVDAGMNHFLRPTLTGDQHRIEILRGKTDVNHADVQVVGPLCTPLDVLGKASSWRPAVGDILAVQNAGAYGFSMSPHFFLGHPMPAEFVLQSGSIKLARRRVSAVAYSRLGR